ncbi:sensor histidine kinase [Bacillus sp. FJAT-49736]|uniref:sensor histidine kinase n=1 Tax=Bacillus sp. FJAT-49736 TaxID=2833582 RepID=UPI001BC8D6ED|nr:sensor histidine kinase [Bacillus sp. FJAT-49736]MBS4174630.1 sensor histidine kinase [Bacillus sp. FJAT-49736]
MAQLLPVMLERAGILIIVAFLLSRLKSFRKIINHEYVMKEKLILITVFGVFGIISNYTGIEIYHHSISEEWHIGGLSGESAIANTRIMGVAIAGLLGGPVVGLGAGLIAGVHRLTFGGYTGIACGISTILAGIITGILGKRFNIRKKNSHLKAVVIGVLMECVQMGIILLIARPFDSAMELVKIIAFPMITINGFGTLIFMLIIQTILLEEDRTKTLQTHKALYIAQLTLPFFRKGLNVESCERVAEIILKHTGADAVSITDQYQVLSHVGLASDHHIPLKSMSTRLTQKVLELGVIQKATTKEEIQCFREDCPLHSAIVLPLIAHSQVVGTLKLYFKNSNGLSRVDEELVEGLGMLFSTQLEFAEAEQQRKLLKDAEIKALQAQVHPHFLFNAINTISCLIRTDADKARKLLLQLSTFFRSNLQGARQMQIPLEKELEHVQAYLTLEQARFPDKYSVTIDIAESIKNTMIPPFTLQPLVENAVHHAFKQRKKKGIISIQAFEENGKINITTIDNGIGMTEDQQKKLGNQTVHSKEGTGTALWNIKKRINEIYGQDGDFTIESEPSSGTKITIILPVDQQKWGEKYAQGLYSG